MTFYRDVPDDMMSANDVELADALLEGTLDTAEAPSYVGVAELIRALDEGPDEDLDPERARATVAAMAAVIDALPTPSRVPSAAVTTPVRPRRRIRAKVAGVALAASMLGTGGVAFAGGLPAGAQHLAHELFAKVGVSIPDTKGGEISDVAHTTPPEGGKGATVCKAASEDKCQAGEDHGHSNDQHGQSNDQHGQAGDQGQPTDPGQPADPGQPSGDHGQPTDPGQPADPGQSGGDHGKPSST